MFLCQKRYFLLKRFALDIQKYFKGYIARENYIEKGNDVSQENNLAFYNYHAVIIQSHVRGHFCRRKILDYNERKKYLNKVKKTNEETLLKLEEYAKAIEYDLERQKEEEKRNKLHLLASNLHHLVSTKNIPGIYNPPHLTKEFKPQINNIDVETHLKTAFKTNLRKSSHFKEN